MEMARRRKLDVAGTWTSGLVTVSLTCTALRTIVIPDAGCGSFERDSRDTSCVIYGADSFKGDTKPKSKIGLADDRVRKLLLIVASLRKPTLRKLCPGSPDPYHNTWPQTLPREFLQWKTPSN